MDIENNKIFTLRIKKIYFDRILSNEKKIEYRDFKSFYFKLSSGDVQYIRFHYQANIFIICEILKIEIIDTPEHLKKSNIRFGPAVYAIYLGKIVSTNDLK